MRRRECAAQRKLVDTMHRIEIDDPIALCNRMNGNDPLEEAVFVTLPDHPIDPFPAERVVIGRHQEEDTRLQ